MLEVSTNDFPTKMPGCPPLDECFNLPLYQLNSPLNDLTEVSADVGSDKHSQLIDCLSECLQQLCDGGCVAEVREGSHPGFIAKSEEGILDVSHDVLVHFGWTVI